MMCRLSQRSATRRMKTSVNASDLLRSASMPPSGSAASTLSMPHSNAAIEITGGVPQR